MRDPLLHLDTVRWNVATIRRAPVRMWTRLRAAGPWLGESWWLKPPARTAVAALVVAAAYYLGALVGFSTSFESSIISPIWPPNAILLVALLLIPAESWWVCLLAVFGAHILIELPNDISLVPATGFFFTNAGEAVLGAFLVRRLSDGAPWLGSLRRVVIYVACAVVAAPVITSFGDAAVTMLAHLPGGDKYWLNWEMRCVSNILAELTIGPALLLALTRAPTWKRDVVRQRWIEAALLSAAVVVAGVAAFGGQIGWHGSATTLVYAVLPVLLWAAVRFGVGGTSAALLGITVVATWSAAQGKGPFSAYSPTENIIELQVFLISFSIPMLILAAVIEERQHALLGLRTSEARYRAVVRNLPNTVVLLFDGKLRHSFADGPGLQMLGLTPEGLEGRTVWEAFPEDLAGGLASHYDTALSGQASDVDVEYGQHIYRIQVVPMPATTAPPRTSAATPTPAGMVVLRDITEQRRARDELVQERTRAALLGALSQEFRTLAEHSPDLIARFDREGRIRYVNQAGAERLGLPAEGCVGKTLAELRIPPDRYMSWAEALRDVVATCAPRTFDVDVQTPEGQLRSVHVRFVPEFADDECTLVSVLGIATDISALKQAEARLAEQAAELEAIFEAQVDGVAVYDLAGRFVRANRALRRLFEIDADHEYTSLPLEARAQRLPFYDEQRQPLPLEQWPLSRVLRGEVLVGNRAVEAGMRRVDGREAWISTTGAPLRAPNEHITGVVLVTRDVTERRALERQVAEQASELEAIFESQADGVGVYDLAGRFVRANRALRDLLGLDADADYTALPFEERAQRLLLFDEQGQPLPLEQWPQWRVLRGEILAGANAMETGVRTLDGRELWISITGAPMCAPDGQATGVVLIARDITARRQLERQVAEQASELEAIFEAQADAVVVYDQHRRFVRGNRAWEAFHQRSIAMRELDTQPAFNALPLVDQMVWSTQEIWDEHGRLIPLDDQPTSRALRGEIVTGSNAVDEWFHSADGQDVQFSVTAAPIRDRAGQITGVVLVGRDVTARRQLERQVAEQAAQLGAIFEAMADGVLVHDERGRIHLMNQAYRDLVGLEADQDYVSLPLGDRVRRLSVLDEEGRPIPETHSASRRVLQGEVISGQRVRDVQMHTLDGREVWVNTTGAPMRAPDGRITGAVLISRDVTARRALERQVREQAAQLEATFAAMTDAVAVLDAQGRVVYHNPAAQAAAKQATGRIATSEHLEATSADRARDLDLRDTSGQPLPSDQEPTARLLRGEVLTGANALTLQLGPRDDRARTMSFTGGPLRDATGHIVGAVLIARDVTELQRAQAALAEQASELEAIFEAKADAVAVYDLQGRFMRANRALRELLGLDADPEYTSRPLDERARRLQLFDEQGQLLPPDQWPHWRVLRGEVLAGASAMEGRMRTVDGRELWISTTGAPMCRPDGQVTGTVLITRDVTARRALERQMAEQAAQLEAIFEAQADGVLVYDQDGRVVRANRAWQDLFRQFCDLTGLSSEPGFAALPFAKQIDRWAELERLNKYLLKDAHGHEIPWVETPTYRALRGETVMGANAVDERVEGPDGRVYETSVSAAPIRDTAGTIVGAVAVARDVTAHRQLERQVQEQASELEAIFETQADGVAVFDIEGRCVRANTALRDLLELDVDPDQESTSQLAEERVERLWLLDEQGQPLPPEQWPLWRVLRGEILAGASAMEARARTVYGRELWISTTGAPIHAPGGQVTGAVLIARDVTARRALERQVAEQAAADERTRLAHELHDTVTQEIFSAGVLAESIARNWREHRAEADAALAQLPALTRGALAGLRVLLLELRPTTLEQVPLPALLRQLAEAMSARARVPIAVRLTDNAGANETASAGTRAGGGSIDPAEPPLPPAVKAALYRMAQEALMNAAKYAKASAISVQLRTRGSVRGGDRDRNTIELEIADDGCGFDPSAIAAGHFGLAMMRERAQAVGATLQVRSQLGRGTRIVVAWRSGRSAAMGGSRRQQAAGLRHEETPHE